MPDARFASPVIALVPLTEEGPALLTLTGPRDGIAATAARNPTPENLEAARDALEALAATPDPTPPRPDAALAAIKARGVKLGKPENPRHQDAGRAKGRARRTVIAGERATDLQPIIADVQASGAQSLRQIAVGAEPAVSRPREAGCGQPCRLRE